MLVHETDLNKGGLPLAAVREECPSDLRGFIFERERSVHICRWIVSCAILRYETYKVVAATSSSSANALQVGDHFMSSGL